MALGEMKADAALDALVSHSISEVNWIAKRGMIQALGDLRNPGAAHILSDMLSRSFDSMPGGKWVIRSAANAIGRIGGDIALKALTDLYSRSTDWFVRLGAVEGLSAMHGIVARGVLAEAAMDPDHRISEVAVAALRRND